MSKRVWEIVTAQLAKDGMRKAHPGEAGWYVTVLVDGEPLKVWATER